MRWLLRLRRRTRPADVGPKSDEPERQTAALELVALEFLDALHEGAAVCALEEATGKVIRAAWSELRHSQDQFQIVRLNDLIQAVLEGEVVYLQGGGGVLRCWTDGTIVDGQNRFRPGTDRIPLPEGLLAQLREAQERHQG